MVDYDWEEHPHHNSWEKRRGNLVARVVFRTYYCWLYEWMVLEVDPSTPKFQELTHLDYEVIAQGDVAGLSTDDEALVAEAKAAADEALLKGRSDDGE